MLEEDQQLNKDINQINQEQCLSIAAPQAIRSHSPMSKSDIRQDNRIQILKQNSSPRKEHLQSEIVKLRDHSKKLLDVIESMGNREVEKNKKIQSQNVIISDLKQKLIQQTIDQTGQAKDANQEQENVARKEDENEIFLALLEELRVKQEQIENNQQKMIELEESLKQIQSSQLKTEQENEEINSKNKEDKIELQTIAEKSEKLQIKMEELKKEEQEQIENLKSEVKRNEEEIESLKQKISNYDIQFRKSAHDITHLTESNKMLSKSIKDLQAEKGSTLRAFVSFVKELFLLVIISAVFSGLKYYISIL